MSAMARQWHDALEVVYRDMGRVLSDTPADQDASWLTRARSLINDAQLAIEASPYYASPSRQNAQSEGSKDV